MKVPVVFCVTREEKEALEKYARRKGLENAGHLARFATNRYIAQYPLKDSDGLISQAGGTPRTVVGKKIGRVEPGKGEDDGQ